jgi:hypothetical protein
MFAVITVSFCWTFWALIRSAVQADDYKRELERTRRELEWQRTQYYNLLRELNALEKIDLSGKQ